MFNSRQLWGNPIFCPLNLFELIVAPMQQDKAYFWEPSFWPINFFMYLLVYIIINLIIYLINNMFNLKDYNYIWFLNRDEIFHEPRLQ